MLLFCFVLFNIKVHALSRILIYHIRFCLGKIIHVRVLLAILMYGFNFLQLLAIKKVLCFLVFGFFKIWSIANSLNVNCKRRAE